MKKINMKIIIVIFNILFVNTIISYSQGLYLGTQVSNISFPIYSLDTIPPLYQNMPLDCIVGYTAMDTISKKLTYQQIDTFLKYTSYDTLKLLLRYKYAVADYNPKLLSQYIHQTAFSPLYPGHISWPSNSYFGLIERVKKNPDSIGRANVLCCFADYILKVKVNQFTSGIDSTFSTQNLWMNVNCTVLKIIKGKVLPNNCNYVYPVKQKTIQIENDSCLNFGYDPEHASGYGFPDRPYGGPGTKFNGLETNTTIRVVSPDSIYYVFLEHYPINDNEDILIPSFKHEANGGIFPVENGQVLDPSNIFGLGTSPSEYDFLNNLNTLISQIQSWW